MAWRQPGGKSLSGPMMVSLRMDIYIYMYAQIQCQIVRISAEKWTIDHEIDKQSIIEYIIN